MYFIWYFSYAFDEVEWNTESELILTEYFIMLVIISYHSNKRKGHCHTKYFINEGVINASKSK